MSLTWHQNGNLIHTQSDETDYEALEHLIDEAATHAISFFDANVKNESRFFLCEIKAQTVTFVVTDDDKKNDSNLSVSIEFTTPLASDIDFKLLVREELRDVLMLSKDYMDYSLLGVFTVAGRDVFELI
jgi:hypothetical protein